jgi:hypothetical protein
MEGPRGEAFDLKVVREASRDERLNLLKARIRTPARPMGSLIDGEKRTSATSIGFER